mgnify:CR=1 FL=1
MTNLESVFHPNFSEVIEKYDIKIIPGFSWPDFCLINILVAK